MYVYKTFPLHSIKAWERTTKKKRDGETGKHKINESAECETEKNETNLVKGHCRVQLFLSNAAH